jgi:hypothetical protein
MLLRAILALTLILSATVPLKANESEAPVAPQARAAQSRPGSQTASPGGSLLKVVDATTAGAHSPSPCGTGFFVAAGRAGDSRKCIGGLIN